WMALVLFVALARFPQGRAGWVLGGVAVVLGCVHPIVITRELRRLEEEEGRGLSAAIDAIPAGRRVAGLVYRPTSRHVRFAPFLHSVAWYQARKGGAIMFSFADYPSWPVRFRSNSRPPRVPSRWEWQPQRVRIPEELAWYEYVLVRGGPGPISAMPELYAPVYRDARWSVWRALSSSARR
ncbi:MAG: hypothetical protein IT379_40125, partial [Deltaproteobacteria bacterium]|nr:hypothetical protein [Deltaproteobacteria bacterium]